MNLETLKKLDKKYAQAIADYLLKRIETDECLLNKLNETNKTLKGCINYIKVEAKKQADDNVAIMKDDDVYELAVHYFLEDSISNEENEDEESTEDVELEETLFGVEEVKKQTKKKPTKEKNVLKREVKEDFIEQLSLF